MASIWFLLMILFFGQLKGSEIDFNPYEQKPYHETYQAEILERHPELEVLQRGRLIKRFNRIVQDPYRTCELNGAHPYYEIDASRITDFRQHIDPETETLKKRRRDLAIKESVEDFLWEIRHFNTGHLPILRSAINRRILGLTQENLYAAKYLFQKMKETGVLVTNIQTTEDYSYSQKLSVKEFLRKNTHVETLVMGCGCCMPHGTCPESHDLSKGEMTVSLPDGFGPAGAHSDIMGDVLKAEFWEGVRAGLETRKLSLIKDHSYYPIAARCIKEIKQVLAPGGILEIAIPYFLSAQSRQIIERNGFVLVDQKIWKNSNSQRIKHCGQSMSVVQFSKR